MINEVIQYTLAAIFLIGALVLVWYIRAKPWLDVAKSKNFVTFINFEIVPEAERFDQLRDDQVITILNEAIENKDEEKEKALEEEAIMRKLIYKIKNV